MVQAELPRFAVLGPGRAGSALARRWHDSGAPCLGFVGRSVESAAAAVEFVGAGRPLSRADLPGLLAAGDVLLVAVQDDALAAAVAGLDTALPAGVVVVHCSGAHDLAVLAPLQAAGLRVGSLHPLCPIPDAAVGYAGLPGQPAVIEVAPGDRATAAVLAGLAAAAGLQPLVSQGGDRLLYHAGCVLAANGLTALFDLVQELLVRGLGADRDPAEARRLVVALMGAALTASERHGPVAALSGPVVRGDAGLIERQLRALNAVDPGAGAVFRALLRRAAGMAAARGALSGAAQAALAEVLEVHG